MLRWAFSTFLVSVGGLAFLVRSTPPPPPPPQPIEFSHKAHLDYYRDGRHRREMIAMHEEMAIRDIGDKEAVADVGKRGCNACHRDFDENAIDLARLARCGQCHRAIVEREGETTDRRPCMGCHNGAAESAQASIPNTKICAACHVPPLGSGPEETKLAGFIKQEAAIRWTQVYDYLPGDIVFSHARHVELGQVRCQECHGPVEAAERPLSLQVELSMEDCMACHEASGASNDCAACHK